MLRKTLVATLVAGVWVVLDPTAALAADNQVVVEDGMHQIQTISLVIGVFLPLLVGLVTKKVTSERTKAVLLAALSAVSGFATEYAQSLGVGTFDWYPALLTSLATFLMAVGLHYGFWKPTGAADSAQRSLVR